VAPAPEPALSHARLRTARALFGMLAWLPLPALHAIGRSVGLLGRLLPNPLRRVARVNVDRCFPQLPPAQRDRLWRDTLAQCGMAASELPVLCARPAAQWRACLDEDGGRARIEQTLAAGRGALVVAPHLGAWELVGVYCAGIRPMTVLYREPRPSVVGTLVNDARRRAGMTPAPATSAGLRKVYRALDRGGLVGVLPDQDPGRRAGVFAPFFGIAARTTTLVARLARRTGAPVLLVVAERRPRGRYRLHVQPAPDGLADADPVRAAGALNLAIEEMTRRMPAQYQWCYKRFRTRPPGEAEIYT